nr:TetR/AcrR family transcriptional regulator [Frankia tisae]
MPRWICSGSAAGLGRGSLYGAFGGKDALFRKCLDRYASIYGAQYERALAAYPDNPVRAVEAFFGVVLDRIADPSAPGGCLLARSASQSPTLNAVNQSLAVLSRAGTTDADLHSVVRIACTTVAETLARAKARSTHGH